MTLRLRYRITLPDGRSTEQAAHGASIGLGRDPSCQVAIDGESCPSVSNLHASIEMADGRFVIVHRSRSNKTLLNDAPVETSRGIKAGDRVKLGYTGPTIELLALESPSAEGHGKTIQADAKHLALLRGTQDAQRIEIRQGGVIGRDEKCDFRLDHPHVSRAHAALATDRDQVAIADLGSSNGTFINGRRLTRQAALDPGDRVDIGPFSLRFDGTALVSRCRSNNVELAALGLRRVVADRGTGEPLVLLDDVTLVVRPREFVCLLGPSGCGKSTLLAALSGRRPPDAGRVAVNGEDLYRGFEALKGDIAVVPQKEVLHGSLAVGAALRYTAELRLPRDTSAAEMERTVSEILDLVGLADRRETLIRRLSGGQVKRTSLANELISRPSLLFLDEVTSGLDEQTDREMMQLFRQVADGGKTVVCVTHTLANVEGTCNLAVILAEGGRLAFIGTPDETKEYFEIPRLGDVYAKLSQRSAPEWQSRFRASDLYRQYVLDRAPVDGAHRGPPSATMPESIPSRASFLRQTGVLVRRYVSVLAGDLQALLAIAGQGLLIALLLGLVFGKLVENSNPVDRVLRTINLQLLLAISSFWFGCNGAAKELVKERIIFHRERDINLRVGAYFLSKLLVLTAVGIVQVLLLFGIVEAWCRLPGSVALQGLTLCVLAIAGVVIGLLISALSRSEDFATALVPIVVIPQIILAGVIGPLHGLAVVIAKGLVTVYWAQESLEGLLPSTDLALIGKISFDWRISLVIVVAQSIAISVVALLVLMRSVDAER